MFLVENAVRLHGHLGPFLVIGVRMGETAKKRMGVNDQNRLGLQARIKTPLFPPFSCVIDGIQATTSCTVGNQKLKIEKSTKKITARFKLLGLEKIVKISVNAKVQENLREEMSKGVDAELLAARIERMQEEQLFLLEEC